MNRAAFLDRDGTINVDVGFLRDPADLRLLPGAAEALRRLRARGYKLIVITNQSGLARGYLDEPTLARIHDRLQVLLRAEDAAVDAFYHCPHLEGAPVARYARPCDCRKPAPGLFLRAARDHGLDLSRSFACGDKERDVVSALLAGCPRAYLLTSDPSAHPDTRATACIPSLLALVEDRERFADFYTL